MAPVEVRLGRSVTVAVVVTTNRTRAEAGGLGVLVDGAGAGRDFFVSYTTADREWALWIVVELERAGYTTASQVLDFRPGQDFVHAMHHAAQNAARTIAVLSPAYFGSRFGEAEWRAAFAADPSGERGLLVPVRVQDCDPPGILSTRVYIDLIGLDETTARARLLRDIDSTGPRPTIAPFPGAPITAPASSGFRQAPFPGSGPAVSNLPARNLAFTGRDDLLTQLHNRLQDAAVAAVLPVEAVHGLGGVGKTELVTEYAHRYADDYDLVWWIDAEQPTTITAALAALVSRLGISTSANQDVAVAALFEQLRRRERWLLIYDNAEEPHVLDGLLPPGGAGSVLVTSRWASWGQRAEPVRVDVLDRAESVQLLGRRTGHPVPAGLNAVAELLGDLPLALEEAAAYLEQTGIGLDAYLKLLTTRARDLFGLDPTAPTMDGGEADRQRVATVWSVSLDRVRVDAPAAEALLGLCAFLGPDIPRSLLTDHPGALPAAVAGLVADPLVFNATLAVLGRYSLAELSPDTVGLHRLVQAVLQGRLHIDQQEKEHAVAAVGLVRAAFPDQAGEIARWPTCERLLPQLLAVCDHAERLAVAEAESGWLLTHASTYLLGRGRYRQARPLAERAVVLAESALGPDHSDIGIRRGILGRALRKLGDLNGARTEYERALQISETALGPDHPDIGDRRNGLGIVLRELGDLDGARTQYERALQISETALGPDHPTIGIRRNNLGRVLEALGNLDGARTQYERALQIGETALGPDHPTISTRLSNLGRVLQELGDLDGARSHLERALQISESLVEPEHPTIGIRRNYLGSLLRALGDLDGARAQHERALQISETALGPHHPDISTYRHNLGCVLQDLGDLDGARNQFERALQISENALGPHHPNTGIQRDSLGAVLQEMGDVGGARDQYQRALQISETALGPHHPQSQRIRTNRNSLPAEGAGRPSPPHAR